MFVSYLSGLLLLLPLFFFLINVHRDYTKVNIQIDIDSCDLLVLFNNKSNFII